MIASSPVIAATAPPSALATGMVDLALPLAAAAAAATTTTPSESECECFAAPSSSSCTVVELFPPFSSSDEAAATATGILFDPSNLALAAAAAAIPPSIDEVEAPSNEQMAAAVVVMAAAAAAASSLAISNAPSTLISSSEEEEHIPVQLTPADAMALRPLVQLAYGLGVAPNQSRNNSHTVLSLLLDDDAPILPEALVIVSKDDAEMEEPEQQPLLAILRENGIPMLRESAIDEPASLRHVLDCIDRFLAACDDYHRDRSNNNNTGDGGRAPGFWTVDDGGENQPPSRYRWLDRASSSGGAGGGTELSLPYECCPTVAASSTATSSSLPVPTVACARRAFAVVRQVVQLRLEWLEQQWNGLASVPSKSSSSSCSCIANWAFLKGQHALPHLINQAFEQMMVEEASQALCTMLDCPTLEQWNDSYRAPHNALRTPVLHYYPATPVSISASRDEYISNFCRAALACQHTIQIATCYIFWDDPAQRYILFDLLPYLVRTKGTQVQLLLDLLVVESFTLRSALRIPPPQTTATTAAAAKASSSPSTSFWDHLPGDRPEPSHRTFDSASHFLQSLVDLSRIYPDQWNVRLWCARDRREHFAIKSHVKCAVFDRQMAFIGGSNITPTVKSATSDLDALLAGPAAAAVGDSFDRLWRAMAPESEGQTVEASAQPSPSCTIAEDNPALTELIQSRHWDDPSARVAILPSTPSSEGNDVILRVVLEKIRAAQSEIVMCMGHSCYCETVVEALTEASDRGVTIKLLVNSAYSNDLRNGQADLFVSLHRLLQAAPAVKVYATLMPHLRDPTRGTHSPRPEFVHAKYVVIDERWSAAGSWNLWTRSAFHEMEHEAFIESTVVAHRLRRKLQHDIDAYAVRLSAEHCRPGGLFCPSGCLLCHGFGPFFPLSSSPPSPAQ